MIVNELMACDLNDYIQLHKRNKTNIPIRIVINIMKQLVDIVCLIHDSNIIHTDIKPENILISGTNVLNKRIIDDINKTQFSIKKTFDLKKQFMNILKKFDDADSNNGNENDSNDNDDDVSSLISLSTSDNNDECTNDNDDNDNCANAMLNSNIKIKMSDMGTCLYDKTSYNVQTRYYRAPEIILQYNCTSKIDVWSIGCVFYELLMQTMMFDPIKTVYDSRNRNHIYNIVNRLGMMPDNIIDDIQKKFIFFTQNNKIKGNFINKFNSLYKEIHDRYNCDADNNQIENICEFIYSCLEYDPITRLSACELKNSKLLNNLLFF
jgi:serine/threonine protein kinase